MFNKTDEGRIEFINDILNTDGGHFFKLTRDMFMADYEKVMNITPAGNYQSHKPNLMQKYVVKMLLEKKQFGNWSGTGAGKTLSYIIASRNMDSMVTVIITLNSILKSSKKAILDAYPDSNVIIGYDKNTKLDPSKYNYILLNYEKFQQKNSEDLFLHMTDNLSIDFIVIDEVHNTKKSDGDESKRRVTLMNLLSRSRANNDNFHILLMSATPVINNLKEPASLIEMITGEHIDESLTVKSLDNVVNMYSLLHLNGVRYIPDYPIIIHEQTPRADCSDLLQDIIQTKKNGGYIALEKLLIHEKLELIRDDIRPGTIIYTYFVDGIVGIVEDYVRELGLKTGIYTGEVDKDTREETITDFKEGKIDVLIGSRPIGTGVDGLQERCDKIIILSLPWTDSEYMQLKGRIYRQGSIYDDVYIIIPILYIPIDENVEWSWDMDRKSIIDNKKTLSAAVVDGIIPDKSIPNIKTLYKKATDQLVRMKERCDNGILN